MVKARHALPVWFVAVAAALTVVLGAWVITTLRAQGVATRRTEAPVSRLAPRDTAPVVRGVTTLASTQPSTTSSVAPLVAQAVAPTVECEYSNDLLSACGPGHWEPAVTNEPARLAVSIDNPNPKVGEVVTFTFTWDDADADLATENFCPTHAHGDDLGCASSTWECHSPFPSGPWPAPRRQSGHGQYTRKVSWDTPGTYEWDALSETWSSAYEAIKAAHPECPLHDPYASRADLSGEITVTAAATTPD